MEPLRVGFFTEIYRPVVNGVVASIEALADGLRGRGHQVYCFAPHMPGYVEADGPVFRMPSLPLPTRTPYRLTLPLVSRRNLNTVIKRLSLVHVHSPFVTGWMGLRYARRYGMPLVYTYHTQLEAYAHYVPFEPNATRFAASQLRARSRISPTPSSCRRRRWRRGCASSASTFASKSFRAASTFAHFGAGRRDEALRARMRRRPGRSDASVRLALAKEKNVELLLEALRSRGDDRLKLVIAGDGPLAPSWSAARANAGVAGGRAFLGVVARDRCRIFTRPPTPSDAEHHRDAGLVLAEALAAGADVIAADAPQNRDVLGGAGRRRPATPQAFAAALAARCVRRPGGDPRLAREAAAAILDRRPARPDASALRDLLETARIA